MNSSHAAVTPQWESKQMLLVRKSPASRAYLPDLLDLACRGLVFALLAACLGAVLVTSLPVEAATYYRWNDDQGKLVVSDRPPTDPSISYEVVNPSSPLIRRVAPGEGPVPAETTPRPGNEFDPVDTNAESEELSQKNPESCARARANLKTLDSAARIRMRNEKTGELEFISDEERDTQRKKAQDIIRVSCE